MREIMVDKCTMDYRWTQRNSPSAGKSKRDRFLVTAFEQVDFRTEKLKTNR